MRSLFLAVVALAVAFGEVASVPARSAESNVITERLPGDGVLKFPIVDGISGVVTLRLTEPAPNDVTVTLRSQTNVVGPFRANLPMPQAPKPPHLLVAYILSVDNPIHSAWFPGWRIAVPATMTLTAPYGIEVYRLENGVAIEQYAYSAEVNGSVITTRVTPCPIPITNGIGCPAETIGPTIHTVFEILQDPPMSQMPRPSVPETPAPVSMRRDRLRWHAVLSGPPLG